MFMSGSLKNQSKWARWCYWEKVFANPKGEGVRKKYDPHAAHYALNQLLLAKAAKTVKK